MSRLLSANRTGQTPPKTLPTAARYVGKGKTLCRPLLNGQRGGFYCVWADPVEQLTLLEGETQFSGHCLQPQDAINRKASEKGDQRVEKDTYC